MKCSDLDEMLLAYVNSELPRTQREFIEEHLSGCADCRAALIEYTEVRQRLSSLRAMQPIPNLKETIMSKIRAANEGSSKAFKEQHRITIVALAKLKVKGGTHAMLRGLLSRQPVWKSIVAGFLALALITGLVIASVGTGQSTAALAADIAKNSPQVKAALGGGVVQEVESVKVTDGKGTVIVRGEPSPANAFAVPEVIVEVDIKTGQVTAIIPMQEFTSADEQKAINIAKNHPEIKNLLNEGAIIVKVFPLFSPGVDAGTGTEELSALSALVIIELGEKKWAAQVDLLSEKVTNLGETTFAAAQPTQAPGVN